MRREGEVSREVRWDDKEVHSQKGETLLALFDPLFDNFG